MAEYWYQNGSSVSALGRVGFDGSNRFNVVYSFTVPSGGASSVTVHLSGIGSLQGSNNTIGIKISTSVSANANAGAGTSPDGSGSLSFSSSALWNGYITASVNLPAGTYYVTVYTYSGSYGYWAQWISGAADVSTSGSYTPPTPQTAYITSISANVNTGNSVVINMNNPGNRSLFAKFYYGSTLLATTEAFTTSISYTCPRSWFQNNISVASMSITARVYYSGGSECDYKSFMLLADSGMKPSIPDSAYTVTKRNTGSIDAFISSLTRIQIDFTVANIDMSATANAEIRSVWIEYNGIAYTEHESGFPYRFITSAITDSGYVRLWCQDSRGRSAYTDYTFTAFSYVQPYLTETEVIRCLSDGEPSNVGDTFEFKTKPISTNMGIFVPPGKNYYTSTSMDELAGTTTEQVDAVIINAVIGSIVIDGVTYYVWHSSITIVNDTSVLAYYKETSDISYTYGARYATSGFMILSANILNTSKTYTVKLVVSDRAGGSKEYIFELSFEEWMLCYTADGDGCGIGQAPGTSHVLQIPSTWELLSGGARFGNDRMVLVRGKHYGTQAEMEDIDSPIEGQVFFVISS